MPSFPVTIVNDPQYSTLGANNQSVVWAIGGKLYTVALRITDFALVVFKSNDGLNWINTGIGSVTFGNTLPSAVAAGSKIMVFCSASNLALQVKCSIFNTVLETWMDTAPFAFDATAGGVVSGCYRASTNEVFFCSGWRPSATGTKCSYLKIDAGSLAFTGPVSCGNLSLVDGHDWECVGILQGNGRLHFIFIDFNTGAGAGVALKQQPLSNADVLGAIQTVDSDAINVDFGQLNVASCDGITVALAWSPTTGGVQGNTFKTFLGASADTIVFTELDILIAFTNWVWGAIVQSMLDHATYFLADCDNRLLSYKCPPAGVFTPDRSFSSPTVTQGFNTSSSTLKSWHALFPGSLFYWDSSLFLPGGNVSGLFIMNLPNPSKVCAPRCCHAKPKVLSNGRRIAPLGDYYVTQQQNAVIL